MRIISRLSLILLFFICLLPEAWTEPWDQDANIKEAVDVLEVVYYQSGISGIAKHLDKCYADFDKTGSAQQLQQCAAIDCGAMYLDVLFSRSVEKKIGKPMRYPYFAQDAFLRRVDPRFMALGLSDEERKTFIDKTWKAALLYVKKKIETGKIAVE